MANYDTETITAVYSGKIDDTAFDELMSDGQSPLSAKINAMIESIDDQKTIRQFTIAEILNGTAVLIAITHDV